VLRETDLRVAAGVLAWLVGTILGLIALRPVWIVVAVAAIAFGTGIASGAGFRRRVTVLSALTVLVVASLAYLVESVVTAGHSQAVPPPGTIIDAQTGEPALHVQHSTPQLAQIGAGSIFRACDRTTEHPCRYKPDQGPLKASPGDLIELGVRLHNGNDASVPYARFTVEIWGGNGTIAEYDADGAVTEKRRAPMSAVLKIEYRTGTSHEGIEEEVEIDVPKSSGYTSLNYVPGSTILTDRHNRPISRLPDGIMDSGLALADIGSPSSCYFCDIRYTRLIFFLARVDDATNNPES
jgi:hypothetical protein